jgi:hypothetical protein
LKPETLFSEHPAVAEINPGFVDQEGYVVILGCSFLNEISVHFKQNGNFRDVFPL